MADNVKVAVRVRPFNSREKSNGAKRIIKMTRTQTTCKYLPNPEDDKTFTFDFSYDSFDGSEKDYANQDLVFNDLGLGVLQNAFDGFNTSLFAYGQTGAGKSYSMVGYGPETGIIPRTCERLFIMCDTKRTETNDYQVMVSMLEIYMEKVKDLLNVKNPPKKGLKVREAKGVGVYVDGLSQNAVSNYKEVERFMEEGTNARTVACTQMNATSSRAHTVFTIYFKQITMEGDSKSEMASKINLIDLAGSERAGNTGASGDTLKEGSAINKSLSALGNVISALALASNSKKGKKVFIPYRNSVLTRLLQESLGGNAKTIMIAAVSPADICYEETMSTLRYADRAKQIKNKAVVNESPTDKLIKDMKAEIERLKSALGGAPMPAAPAADGTPAADGAAPVVVMQENTEEMEKLRAQIMANETMMAQMNQSWEEKLQASQEREEELAAAATGGTVADDAAPRLLNLNEDELMSESVIYYLKDGETSIGRGSRVEVDVKLSGLSILDHHVTLANAGHETVTIVPQGKAAIYVNGKQLRGEPVELAHNDRLVFGQNHFFRYHHPVAAEEEAAARAEIKEKIEAGDEEVEVMPVFDWEYANNEMTRAMREAMGVSGEPTLSPEVKAKQKALEARVEQLQAKWDADPVDEEAKAAYEKAKTSYDSFVEHAQAEMRDRFLFEENLMKTIPMVNEVNIIAKELGRPQTFEVKIQAKDVEVAGTSPMDEMKGSAPMEVMVKVTDTNCNRVVVWNRNEFMNKVFAIRELYQNFVEHDEQFLTPAESHDEDGNEVATYHTEDPFHTPAAPTLLGKSHVYLQSIAFSIDIDDNTPIIDSAGKQFGELGIHFAPCTEGGNIDDYDDFVDDPSELVGKALHWLVQVKSGRGLPDQKTLPRKGIEIRYNHYHDESPCTSGAIATTSINPTINYRHQITVDPVVPDYVRYLEKDALTLETWVIPPVESAGAGMIPAGLQEDLPAAYRDGGEKCPRTIAALASASASSGPSSPTRRGAPRPAKAKVSAPAAPTSSSPAAATSPAAAAPTATDNGMNEEMARREAEFKEKEAAAQRQMAEFEARQKEAEERIAAAEARAAEASAKAAAAEAAARDSSSSSQSAPTDALPAGQKKQKSSTCTLL